MWRALTPLDFYRRSRKLFGDKTAVVDEDRRLTFAGFADRVELLAGALRAAGLKPRASVSVLSSNTHALLEAFYGVPLAGGVVHPLNPRLAPLEVAALVNDAGSRILLFEGGLAPVVREVLGNLKAVEQFVVVEGDPRTLDFPAREYESLREGARASEADLLRHAARHLARFKIPRTIEFVSSLPLTESGEVVKSELRTLYAS